MSCLINRFTCVFSPKNRPVWAEGFGHILFQSWAIPSIISAWLECLVAKCIFNWGSKRLSTHLQTVPFTAIQCDIFEPFSSGPLDASENRTLILNSRLCRLSLRKISQRGLAEMILQYSCGDRCRRHGRKSKHLSLCPGFPVNSVDFWIQSVQLWVAGR